MKLISSLLGFLLLFTFSGFTQKSFTSVQNGDWNDASTWTLGAGAGGTEGIDYPSASDIVTIDHFVVINATNNGSNFSFTGKLTINVGDTLESQVGNNVAGFVLEGDGIMRNFGSFFTLDASEEPDPGPHIPYEFVCKDNSIFIGGLNSFAFISDDWNIQDNAQIFLDNLLCYAVSDDVIFDGTGCQMYGAGNIRIGGDGASSNVEFINGATNAQLDDDITIWRNVAANDCSGTSLSTGTNTDPIPPFALDDEYTTTTNVAQAQFVLTEGDDDFSPVEDDTLTLISVGNNAAVNNGNTTLGGTVSINNNGTPSDPTDDFVDYTPPAATTGTDTYSYIINNLGGGADTALVTIEILTSIADRDGDGITDDLDIDDDNDGILDVDECGGQTQTTTFNYTGADQTYNIPNNTTEITAKIWGAGGRGDEESGRGTGGAGGYTEITINVSDLTSTSLIVTVGEGGNSSTGSVTYGNGGAGLAGGGRNYGAGGGMSAISYTTLSNPGVLSDADLVAIAGGGGTAAAFTNAGSQAGEGGGTNGQNGSTTDSGGEGGGGTQSAGGASSGGNPGSFLLGGDAVSDGGAGGGGYYGGGSGFLVGSNEGVGGGGSGYVDPAATSSTTTAGTGQTPPNTGDADYVAGTGEGGDNGGDNGGNGLVVIIATIDSCDTDEDGIINRYDLDSDNDGIADIIEAGGEDTNGDGKVDVATDTDGDGWANTFDSDNGGTALDDPDTDGDGIQNRNDIDADGDGIVDVIEGQASGAINTPSGSDADNDGIDDSFDPDQGNALTVPVNTDGTDDPDYTDTNSDNDADLDALEGYDTDNDGVANTTASGSDSDNDGLDDNYDNVSGSNATTNVTNGGQTSASFPNLDVPATNEADWREIVDNDGDGIADVDDIDDDNDGILDVIENISCPASKTNSLAYEFYDLVPTGNTVDNIPTTGALSTGSVTEIDVDNLQGAVDPGDANSFAIRYSGFISISTAATYTFFTSSDDGSKLFIDGTEVVDNDGNHSVNEESGTIFLGVGSYPITILFYEDGGGEFLSASYESASITKTTLPFSILSEVGDCDTDNDGIPDQVDIDADNDGIPDIIEAGGVDTNNDGRVDDDTDTDGDGYADTFDSDNGGTALTNPDTDGDGINNFRDLDSDSDGITDNVEGQTTAEFIAPSGDDTDGDGWDNQYDSDNGGTAITLSNNDGSGEPDYLDEDSDGDGQFDYIEGFDDDGDGFAENDLLTRANNYETSAGNPLHYVNSDNADADGIPDWAEDDDADGTPNYLDPDSGFYIDNDGDGMINLFDPDDDGAASNTPDTDGDGEYNFRDTDDQTAGLPVELLEFKAEVLNEQVLLSWTTLTEINNDYFIVERSIDGQTFEPVLRKKGNGNSTIERNYQAYDRDPYVGMNYYRLSQFDYDGTAERFDNQIQLAEFFQTGFAKLLLYPNPTNNKLYLKFQHAEPGEYRLEVMNSAAKLLLTKSIIILDEQDNFSAELLNGELLPKGMYLLRVQNGSIVEVLNFIIQ